VWICPSSAGHLQATGRDARRRKQYLYHEAWIAERDSNKFEALGTFAAVLPRIRRAIRRDLRRPDVGKERVLAAVVQLMDLTFIRVGGERHRRENGSFGLTTLRNRHVKATGASITLDFRGKSGKHHRIEVDDARVARVVRRCLDLPGQVLFQYEDGDEPKGISAPDVNDYLRTISGATITSKDFRTWGGTVCAAAHLAKAGPPADKTALRRNLRDAIKAASEVLGNTPAVCKRSYVAPVVLSSYEAGALSCGPSVAGMRKAECTVIALLGGRARPSPKAIPRATQAPAAIAART
jgi:DNA topoisomerase-1